jgi:hypothetical protein
LNFLVPEIGVMTVWSELQRAGEKAATEAAKVRKAVFEQGAELGGLRKVDRLNIEADGVGIELQRAEVSRGELKLIVGYEGKEGKPKRLKNRRVVAGLVDGETIWEEASCYFGGVWALGEIEHIRIGGDGAEWIKGSGKAYFPQASFHLDLFHLRQRLTETLGFSPECYEAVANGIAELDREAVSLALAQALKQALSRPAKKRVHELARYLMSNWDGIAALPEEERLGAVEGEVRHIIARRMKRIGARWTIRGGDHMARLLAHRANRELARYAGSGRDFAQEVLRQAVGQERWSI